jgi:hypothetical protein
MQTKFQRNFSFDTGISSTGDVAWLGLHDLVIRHVKMRGNRGNVSRTATVFTTLTKRNAMFTYSE